jgi:hypothetical protein
MLRDLCGAPKMLTNTNNRDKKHVYIILRAYLIQSASLDLDLILDDYLTLPSPVHIPQPKPTPKPIPTPVVKPLPISVETSTADLQTLELLMYSSQFMKIMEPNEVKRELKKLNDLHNSGYIQNFEYEERKSKLNALSSLQSTKKKSSSSDTSSTKKPKERVVRLFLSSTFRDMQLERDELIKLTFPTLKSYCQERGVSFNEIDLR